MGSNIEQLSSDIQAALAEDLTIDITTTGRRSGLPRRIEIWFLNVDDTIYITGTPGPRDWYANLVADPLMTFHLKESVQADLPATATVVTNRTERQKVFTAASATWYSNQGDGMESLLTDAPMVRLDFAS